MAQPPTLNPKLQSAFLILFSYYLWVVYLLNVFCLLPYILKCITCQSKHAITININNNININII